MAKQYFTGHRKSGNEIKLDQEVTRLASKYGDDYIKILTKAILEAGKSNTGRLIDSIQFDLVEIAGEIVLQLSAEDYLEYVNYGRAPGTYPNMDAISEWVDLKGLPQEATFPIAHNIFKYGIPPSGIYNNAIEEIDRFTTKALEEDLTDEILERIVDRILAINAETNKIK